MLELKDRAVALHDLLDVAGTFGHDLPAVGRLLTSTLRDAEELAASLLGGQAEAEA
jgi:hypothetical protein